MKRFDVYSRFARRHLVTPEQRAVYLALVGQEAGCWSAGELAERTRLDPDETERVLEAFEAAGVVQTISAPDGHRFRWRSDLGYLFGDEGEDPDLIDPVCGMPVLAESPFLADDPQHGRRRFCSAPCLEEFLASPTRFVGPPAVIARAATR